MATNMTITVDLARTVFEIAVSDGNGKIIERQRLSRCQVQRFFQTGVATVVMEACSPQVGISICDAN